MTEKIRIGVSSCLIGEKVRWNGDHKQDRYVREILSRYFEYIPVCPEVEAGMGGPLYSEFGSHKVKHRHGMFANAFINSFPLVSTEDEGRLNGPRIRENFIVRIFSFKIFNLLLNEKFSLGQWVKLLTQYKFLLLAIVGSIMMIWGN